MNQGANEQGPGGLSIAALVTGILGLGIVPIILGAIDLSKIKNGVASQNGKGFDIAGIVLGGLTLIGWIIFGVAMAIFGSFWYYFY
ncbi:MAG: DUF4190 domain-containing protein [Actinomycetota bacterium]|nr:DUF4190 domain-containing protein [Actinomycetota bacterium]